jgi:hypothetical protein
MIQAEMAGLVPSARILECLQFIRCTLSLAEGKVRMTKWPGPG